MTKITPIDRENLIKILGIISHRCEGDAEMLCRLLENGEAPLPSDATFLMSVAREFVDAWEEEPGAKEDPNRADYTGLMDRLGAIAGE